METIAISAFKATCLAVLERVRKTHKPVLVTRFGEPVAEIIPPPAQPRAPHWIGSLSGTAKITGDIVAPAAGVEAWESLAARSHKRR